MTPLERIIERIGDINDPATPHPLLSLEEFFEGNDDFGSIGYNFSPSVAPVEFYAHFIGIRSKLNVYDVLVEVQQHEIPDEWPSSDTIWIVTSASPQEVLVWLGEKFRPDDELFDGFPTHRPMEPYEIPNAMKAWGVWWD